MGLLVVGGLRLSVEMRRDGTWVYAARASIVPVFLCEKARGGIYQVLGIVVLVGR